METLRPYRGVLIFEGILFAILGCLAIALPQFFTIAIELLIGWLFLIGGIFLFFRAFKMREGGPFWPTLISGILNIAIGILLLVYPIAGVLSLTMLLIAFFILDGFAKLFLSFELKPLKNWGWVLVSSILSIVLAFLLISGWPGTAAWAIGLLVGINMLFSGISLITFGYSLPEQNA